MLIARFTFRGVVVVAIMTVIFLMPSTTRGQFLIQKGIDAFSTQDGTNVEIALPAGFFGSKNGVPSDSWSGTISLVGNPEFICPPRPVFKVKWVDPHGNEVEADSRHAVEQEIVEEEEQRLCDTIIQRSPSTEFSEEGAMVVIRIQLLKLSLKSESPIEVTFGGQPPSSFDVSVKLSPNHTQPVGKMKATITTITDQDCSGSLSLGTAGPECDDREFSKLTDPSSDCSGLPIIYLVTFNNVNRGEAGVQDTQQLDNLRGIFHTPADPAQQGSFTYTLPLDLKTPVDPRGNLVTTWASVKSRN